MYNVYIKICIAIDILYEKYIRPLCMHVIRAGQKYTNSFLNWNSLYKFYIKLLLSTIPCQSWVAQHTGAAYGLTHCRTWHFTHIFMHMYFRLVVASFCANTDQRLYHIAFHVYIYYILMWHSLICLYAVLCVQWIGIVNENKL